MKHTGCEVESGHVEASVALERKVVVEEKLAGMEDDGEGLEAGSCLPLRILLAYTSVFGAGGLWPEGKEQFVG